MKTARNLAAVLIVLLIPSFAYANGATVLMFAGAFHFVFGNAIIGILEGLLVGFVFKAPKLLAILLLVAANYFSAWFGGLFILYGGIISNVQVDIENVRFWFWMFLFLAFLITLVTEYPFVLFAFWKREHMVRRSIVATLVVNVVSYLLLVGWYWTFSNTSIVTELELVHVEQMQLPEGYDLYYLNMDGRSVVKADLHGKTEAVLKSTMEKGAYLLFARSDEEGKYDLCLYRPGYSDGGEDEEVILEDFSSFVPEERTLGAITSPEVQMHLNPDLHYYNHYPVTRLGATSDWTYNLGYFWGFRGISGENKAQNLHFHYALETPFFAWHLRHASHLPNDLVVLQINDDQICILDPQGRKIALIARGRSPFVVKDKEERQEE